MLRLLNTAPSFIFRSRRWALATTLACVPICLGASAGATTYTITATADTGAGCTLRNALEAAVSDTAVGTCAAGSASDVIELQSTGFYAFSNGQILMDEDAEGHVIDVTVKGLGAAAGDHILNLGTIALSSFQMAPA